MRQYRSRHLDIVVEREHANNTGRRLARRRQPRGKLGAGHRLDRRGELGDDVIEEVHLI